MLICVYGEDGVRITEKVNQLRQQFIEKFDVGGMNVSVFGAKEKPGVVISSIKSGGLLSSKRFVVVENLVENTKSDSVDTWVDTLCKTDRDAIIVLKEIIPKVKFNKQPLGKAIKDAESRHDYDFPLLSGSQLASWVSHEANSLGGKINPAAINKLASLVGDDTWQLHQETRKLVGLADGKTVTIEMVSDLVKANFDDKIFDFIDAATKQQSSLAVKLLDEQRMGGVSDSQLLSMLMRQIRVLLGVRGLLDSNPQIQKDEAAVQLSLHPYVVQKAMQHAKKFRLSKLIDLHDLVFDLERKTKLGQMRPNGALERLLTELLKQ